MAYPFTLDTDETIIRVDDNISELGGLAIDQLRDAMFNVQGTLGLEPHGSKASVAERLDVSLNQNGTIKASALTAVGLVTLPITDAQVGSNAGIKETKLALDHTTGDLYTNIVSNKVLLDAVNAFAGITNTDFLKHLSGADFLSNGTTSARHVASHIDLNSVPTDARDPSYTWTGLLDKAGNLRNVTNVASALLVINDDLTSHENAVADAHVASAITVDTDHFEEIPMTADTVQKVIDYLDDSEVMTLGEHRAVQHSSGVAPIARSQSVSNPDGYGIDMLVPPTIVNTYLMHPPAVSPVDSNTVGDDIIKFLPSNTGYVFDSQFSKVHVGDVLRVNYGNGIETSFVIDSIRFTPGSEWVVRVNGVNLAEAVDGYVDGYEGIALARIDRPMYDRNTAGVLALAAANSIPNTLYPNIIGSVIVGNPKSAVAVGLGFDGNQLNQNHYKLWLELYPTGNPSDRVISLPYIDVTGDAGASSGTYTLSKVIAATNDAFRKIGYNYRFIAFDHQGDFGIMLTDAIDNASFAILSGNVNSSGVLIEGSYDKNVVGDVTDGFDALGLGAASAGIASPAYQSSFVDSTAALMPTNVISPAKRRFYIADGQRRDSFAPTYLANKDGYWPAVITNRVSTGSSIEVTYKVELDLKAAKLKPGKTLTIQPTISFDSAQYYDNDYGRFVIKDIAVTEACGDVGAYTLITVINGIHALGNGIGFSSSPGLHVRMFFGEDSVSFNDLNVIDSSVSANDYRRLHEIYVDRHGMTFSHERARLKIQNESSVGLRTDHWHIDQVSPKLRGYRDGNVTFNRYVRFYIMNYDAGSGEFDGYIGQKVVGTDLITNVGPLTTGRKGVVTRFYDETYLDYIDLEFKEITSAPGIAILSDSNAHYVDIELFPSSRLNDEMLLIGTCEVNWDPVANQNIVMNVHNMVATGSIDAIDFTQDAIEFISAGDRYLHENGVVSGFEYVSSGVSTGELFFKGGRALVNGTLVASNNMSVTIPQIANEALPTTVEWAICVNEKGYLEPIVLTDTKEQFFAGAGTGYYVPSVTFNELTNVRKDLTMIAIVTAHIASITINDDDVKDMRRFVRSEGQNHPLVLTQDKQVGNFNSFSVVKEWINHSSYQNNLVRVRGEWHTSETIDLTGFENAVTFEGDGCVINTTASKGVTIGSNVTLRGISFTWVPPSDIVYASNDKINTGNGCIYAAAVTTDLSKITIEDCTFEVIRSTSSQRPPVINVELNNGKVIDRLRICDNEFVDPALTYKQAAIAVVSLNNAGGTEPALLLNSKISGNVCDRDQGVYVTIKTTSGIVTFPGMNVSNVTVEQNRCGTIGCINTAAASTLTNTSDPPLGLWIVRNTAHYIATLNSAGILVTPSSATNPLAFGRTTIESNSCNWIHVTNMDGGTSSDIEQVDLQISRNVLTGYDDSYLSDFTTNLAFIINCAIVVYSYPNSVTNSSNTSVTIDANQINYGYYNGVQNLYLSGISSGCSANITNNRIRGIKKESSGTFDGYGIVVPGITFGDGSRNYIITNNAIYRDSNNINAYIVWNGSDIASTHGLITDNFFDSSYCDDASSNDIVVLTPPMSWTVDRNINQIFTQYVGGDVGRLYFGLSVGGPAVTGIEFDNISDNAPDTYPTLSITYITTGALSPTPNWIVNLNSVLPLGAIIIDVTVSAKATNLLTTAGIATPVLRMRNPTTSESNGTINFTTTLEKSITITPTNTIKIRPENNVVFDFGCSGLNSSSTSRIDLKPLVIRYRF